MAPPSKPLDSDDSFSKYFTPDDEIIEILQSGPLPGDIQLEPTPGPSTSTGTKRPRPRSQNTQLDGQPPKKKGPLSQLSSSDKRKHDATDKEFDVYGASSYGGFGEYMSRKRAKLQIQNTEIDPTPKSDIMKGVAIYINGYTNPSIQELRRMIVEQGGVFQPYLDKKSIVTHIITTSITTKKREEWKHMKVVTPDWITESVKVGERLPWRDFTIKVAERNDGRQGTVHHDPSAPQFQSQLQVPPAPSTSNSATTPQKFDPKKPIPVTPARAKTPISTSSVLASVAKARYTTPTKSPSKRDQLISEALKSRASASPQGARASSVSPLPRRPSTTIDTAKNPNASNSRAAPQPPKPAAKISPRPPSSAALNERSASRPASTSAAIAASKTPLRPPVPSTSANHSYPASPSLSKNTTTSASPIKRNTVPAKSHSVSTATTPASRSELPKAIAKGSEAPKVQPVEPAKTVKPTSGPSYRAPEVKKPVSADAQDWFGLKPMVISKTEQTTLQFNGPPKSPSKAKPESPIKKGEGAIWEGYALHDSNPHAKVAMQSAEWRQNHTSVSENFIKGYYQNSRLHYLSTWKAELKNIVAQAQEQWDHEMERAIKNPLPETVKASTTLPKAWSMLKGKGKENEKTRVIMHCDFDSFFVAAGLVNRPELKGKPVVVCHSQGKQGGNASTSEVASASYEARQYGIRNGMSLGQARRMCGDIVTIPYEFEKYKKLSLRFYTILLDVADDVQAVSVDEALIEVTSAIEGLRLEYIQKHDTEENLPDFARDFAEDLRDRVREDTGCEVSIGVSYNILLARLATRHAKPAGSYHISKERAVDFLSTVSISQLWGIGNAIASKAEAAFGTTLLGELGKQTKEILGRSLGPKTGETIWNAARGIDHARIESDKPRKSVSCDINFGIRFENSEQAEKFIYQMANEVSSRMSEILVKGKHLTLRIMKRHPRAPEEPAKFLGHGHCEVFTRSTPMASPGGDATSDPNIIGKQSWRLLSAFNFDPRELRGIAIQIQKLEPATGKAEKPVPSWFQPKSPQKPLQSEARENTHVQASAQVEYPGEEVQPSPPPPPPEVPVINILPPSQPSQPNPAYSTEGDIFPDQLDPTFLAALPPDIRKEVEDGYAARKGGARASSPTQSSSQSKKKTAPPKATQWEDRIVDIKSRRRIAHALAPRSEPTMTKSKTTFFERRAVSPNKLNVPIANLMKLGIDPEVFDSLPVDDQREQLAIHRGLKRREGKSGKVFLPRAKVQPVGRAKPGEKFVPRVMPLPKANKISDPVFVRKSNKGRSETKFVTQGDLQDLVQSWVDNFIDQPPRERDIDYFAKYLEKCVDHLSPNEVPIVTAIAVLKWWRFCLQAKWPEPEWSGVSSPVSPPLHVDLNDVGGNWWVAFWEVKSRMDVALRPKFGGIISLK